jgi:hypothetical protein
MEIEQVAEMARAFAALPQSHRDFFDGMVADERAKDAEAKRIAKLRAMGDLQALDFILKDARRGMSIFDLDMIAVGRGLVEAGFVRGDLMLLGEAREALERVVRLIVDSASQFPVGFDYAELNRLIMQAATALSKVEAGRS